MTIKSFEEYFEGYKNYDDGGKLDQTILADAKKVFEKLKTPELIELFQNTDYQTQQDVVKGLDEGHSGASFASVCSAAHKYAEYKANEEPFTFDEFYAGYKNYDDGGKLDQTILADAKKVFETLKTPKAINKFLKSSYKKQQKMVSEVDLEQHSGFSFSCVCNVAYKYAMYASKYIKENPEDSNTNKFAELRKKMAQKIDNTFGTNIETLKIPQTLKSMETAISKKLDKGNEK